MGMDTSEQPQKGSGIDPDILNETVKQHILSLTMENIHLGAYVTQLKQQIVELSARQKKGEADDPKEAD